MTLSKFQRFLWIASVWAVHSTCLSATPENEKLMEVLLRPTGWGAEWSGPGFSGFNEVTFERRGGKIFVRISLIRPVDYATKCEKPVTVGANSVTFDGCYEPNVTLNFNPSDPEFPFRGSTPSGFQWKLKAK